MKKKAIIVLLGLLTLSTAGFAKGIAIGAEAASRGFNSWGGRFVFHLPSVPLYFGVGATSNQGTVAIDATIDYWLAHGHVASIIDGYIGIGLYGAVASSGNFDFALGARLPLGLQIWPLKGNVLEIFLEVAPAWIPLSSAGLDPLVFELQPAIGFRIWF
jgi:hypothetical protein